MKRILFTALLSAALLSACTMRENPLLTPSPLAFGAPQFDQIQTTDYLPAFRQAFQEARAEVETIIANEEAPTFANTIEALDFAGGAVSNVSSIFYNLLEADANDELQAIAEEIVPMANEFSTFVMQNEQLFARIKAVYEQREGLDLDAAQQKLLVDTYRSFQRNGALLDQAKKDTLAAYNEQLSMLSLQFNKNSLASNNAFSMLLTDEADLAGLPAYVREMGAQAAKEKGQEGWLFNLSAPSYSGFIMFSDKRDLREKIYIARNRVAFGDEWDNSSTVRQLADLRSRKAALLGYKDYADYQTEDRMVGSGEAVRDFLRRLTEPALAKAHKEVAEVEAFARLHGFEDGKLQPWDFSYWSEKLRQERYAISDEELKPYFRLEDCIEAIFSLAGRLYGISFKPVDLPVYHPDVKVYEVVDADGSHLALFYADFFPRESKRSGAWMTSFRDQKIVDGTEQRPFISLVTNFTKPTQDTPSLITHDEFITLLHEFGHSLHGILAQGRYPSQTGTNVDHDFVELPSQIMENWGYQKEFLQSFAKHYQTGEPIPSALIDKIVAAKNFESAYYHIRQIQFGTLDMAWHTLTALPEADVPSFEQQALSSLQVLPEVPGTLRSTSFTHIFSGGYAAGYYSYKWAEVLAADGFSLFEEKGIFDAETAAAFRRLLEAGGSVDAAELYRSFRGHDPAPEALLRQLAIL